jgi:uncharacterized membrane protein YeaQ/YmgE (transglycosylase-associated protein family)
MNLIVSLIIGGIVGWLASIVMKTNAQMGLIANVIVGIVGSAMGFWLAGVARPRGERRDRAVVGVDCRRKRF